MNKKNLLVFNNLSNKEKLALATTSLVLLVVVIRVISIFNQKDSLLDYSNFDVKEVIDFSEESFDRQTYLDLTNIVRTFLASYNLEINAYRTHINYDIINYKIEDYYYALSADLQKYMSKEKYIEIVNSMCKKFVLIDRYGEYVPDNNRIIKNVYVVPEYMYGNGYYICCLNTKMTNTTSYIGIKLDSETKQYNIFYLE